MVRAARTSAPISTQVRAHKDAVSLFERHANGGDNTDLKNWAGKALPALKHHLKIAQNLDKSKSATVFDPISTTNSIGNELHFAALSG
jgi:hypothetical protein